MAPSQSRQMISIQETASSKRITSVPVRGWGMYGTREVVKSVTGWATRDRPSHAHKSICWTASNQNGANLFMTNQSARTKKHGLPQILAVALNLSKGEHHGILHTDISILYRTGRTNLQSQHDCFITNQKGLIT